MWRLLIVVRRKFSWRGFIQCICWSFVFGVRCLSRHNLTSFPCFQTNILAKFVDTICTLVLFCMHSLYYICHCTEYKLSALQVRILEENTLNATTQQFITAKISDCSLKQGSKTQPTTEQFRTAKTGCANVSSNTSSRAQVCGWNGAHPGLQDRILIKLHKN